MANLIVRKAYYDTPEGQVHYRYLEASNGDGFKYPIFFLHMCPASSSYYEELMQICAAQGYDCYAPDMPGFGNSYNPNSQPPGIKYYVDAFMPLIDHVGSSKVHVLGHHSGASIATEMAILHPDTVQSLTLCGPALLNQDEQATVRPIELVMFNKPMADGSHLLKSWERVREGGHGDWDTLQLHEQVLDTVRSYEGRIQIYTCVFNQPMIDMLGKVTCPVLAMDSEQDMLHQYTLRVKDLKPDSSLASVAGGNWEVLKDPEGVSRELLKFII